MSLMIKSTEQMSEGLHDVAVTKVEDLSLQESQSASKEMAAIYFTAREGKPHNASLRVIKSLRRESNVVRLLTALNVRFGETFDLNALVGVSCQVVVLHKEKDGKTCANVVAVLKRRRG